MAQPADWIDPRDRDYVDTEPDPARREAIRCTIATYRTEDRLAAGDPCPPLSVYNLETAALESLRLAARPTLLVFGSYT